MAMIWALRGNLYPCLPSRYLEDSSWWASLQERTRACKRFPNSEGKPLFLIRSTPLRLTLLL